MHIGNRYLEVLQRSLVVTSRLALAKPLGYMPVYKDIQLNGREHGS